MSRKVRIILSVILCLVLIGCIVGLRFWTIHLFDQNPEEVSVWCFVGNVLCWVGALGSLLVNIICDFYDDFDAFRY